MIRYAAGILCLVLASVSVGAFVHGQAMASPTRQVNRPMIYSVKFVCGFEPLGAEKEGRAPVKPGNYETEINLFNPHQKLPATVAKRVLVLVSRGFLAREPRTVRPVGASRVQLVPLSATMDDCPLIRAMAHQPPAVLMIGFLVIVSSVDLDVDAVYTASPALVPSGPAGVSSEQVVRIPGKVLLP